MKKKLEQNGSHENPLMAAGGPSPPTPRLNSRPVLYQPGTSVRVRIPESDFEELRNGVDGVVAGGEEAFVGAASGRLAVTHKLEGRPATRLYDLRHVTLATD